MKGKTNLPKTSERVASSMPRNSARSWHFIPQSVSRKTFEVAQVSFFRKPERKKTCRSLDVKIPCLLNSKDLFMNFIEFVSFL